MSILIHDAATTVVNGDARVIHGNPAAIQIEGSGFTGTWSAKVRMTGMTWQTVATGSGDDNLQIPPGWDQVTVDISAISAGSLTVRMGAKS